MFNKYGHILERHLVVYWKDIAPSLLLSEKRYGLRTNNLPKGKYDNESPGKTINLILTINHKVH